MSLHQLGITAKELNDRPDSDWIVAMSKYCDRCHVDAGCADLFWKIVARVRRS